MDKNAFEVLCLNENEDGSVDIEVSAEPEMRTQFVEEGINFLLVKGALGGNTEEILRWATRGKEEEQNDKIAADFNATMAEISYKEQVDIRSESVYYDNMINDQIYDLAVKSRLWGQNVVTKHHGTKLSKIRGWDENLTNLCVSCSTMLAFLMSKRGYKCFDIVDSGSHSFVLYKKYVIDVTATQFGDYDKVLIKPYTELKGTSLMWSEGGSNPKIEIEPWGSSIDKLSFNSAKNLNNMMKIHVNNI